MAFTAGFCVGPVTLGIDFTRKDSTQQHPIGMKAFDNKGRRWVYVKFNGTVALGNLVKATSADDPYTNVVIGTASNAGTAVIGMAGQGFVAGNFGWIVQTGIFEDDAQIVTASVAPGDPLICDANGDCTIALETDINNIIGHCLVDDTDNTGTVLLDCVG